MTYSGFSPKQRIVLTFAGVSALMCVIAWFAI